MRSPSIPSPHTNHLLPCRLTRQAALILATTLLMGTQPLSAHADENFKISWGNALPCEDSYAKRLPNQNEVGLGLYKFECPNNIPRIISGTLSLKLPIRSALSEIQRGEQAMGSQASEPVMVWVSRSSDLPILDSDMSKTMARRTIQAGTPLLRRDFEARRLWQAGQAVSVVMHQGAITSQLMAVSLSPGNIGGNAKAKLENGKVLSGIAEICGDAPCLLIKNN